MNILIKILDNKIIVSGVKPDMIKYMKAYIYLKCGLVSLEQGKLIYNYNETDYLKLKENLKL